MRAWCIDFCLNGKIVPEDKLEVTEYDREDLERELWEHGAFLPEALTDYDRCVFSREDEAEKYLKRYLKIYSKLPTQEFCLSRDLPSLPYRTRNIVQTLMGHKLQTYRNYKKDWQPGQLFNLHDRRSFITVELNSLTEVDHGWYCYRFTNTFTHSPCR